MAEDKMFLLWHTHNIFRRRDNVSLYVFTKDIEEKEFKLHIKSGVAFIQMRFLTD
jgi:hypothetical protein